MSSGQVLRILTKHQQVVWNAQTLEFQEREVRLLALLGLIHPKVEAMENDGLLSVDQIASLQGFRHLKPNSVPATVRRFVVGLEERGLNWITSPKGKQLEFFRLDPSVVRSVVFDLELYEVQVWLGLDTPKTVETLHDPDLLMAEVLLQAGKWAEAEALLQEMIGRPILKPRAAPALLALSQLRLQQQRLEDAWQLLQRAEDSAVSDPSGDLQVLIQLQRARLNRINGDLAEAESIALSLRKQIRSLNSRVSAQLETLMGLLILDNSERELLEAQGFFERALHSYAQGHSWWGVQATYANLGLLFFKQAQSLWSEPGQRTDWLNRASRWFERCYRLCKQSGFGYESPDVLIYWLKCKRLLSDWNQHPSILSETLELSLVLELSRSQAEVLYEQGEYYWSQGQPGEARAVWQQALELSGEDEQQFVRKQIGGRLSPETLTLLDGS